jgi:glycine oxidase
MATGPAPERLLIIGGGVVGLAVGWKVAQRGVAVTILERGQAGCEASWAAAGMLGAAAEAHFQDARNVPLRNASLALYPAFVRELEAATGQDVDYRTEGTIELSLEADHTAELRRHYDYQREHGLPVEWLSGDAVRELEPQLSNYAAAGVLCAADHQVDNRRLVTALRAAFLGAGGELHEQTEVERLIVEQGRCVGVLAAGERRPADAVLVAAGSWSGMVGGLPPAERPPVRPVKGQMLALGAPDVAYVRHVIRTPDVYIVPKSDGRIVLGATVEEMGFNRELTAGGIYELLKGAWEAMPGVYDLPIVEMWCGFRPGSRDDSPLLGATGLPGLYMACGHYRNGILMTPGTAVHMATLLVDGTTPEVLKPYDPRRFASV